MYHEARVRETLLIRVVLHVLFIVTASLAAIFLEITIFAERDAYFVAFAGFLDVRKVVWTDVAFDAHQHVVVRDFE